MTEIPPLKTFHTRFNNLPVQLTSLIGREQQVAAVCALLRRTDVRLVTLTGTGGIGKTRLSLQIATELFDTASIDGVCFVSLAPISNPLLVIPAIAHVLGLDHQHVVQHPMTDALDDVKAFLREKRFLLLLDNFEQVVSAAPDIAELLIACPHMKILVTSRAVLHIQGEQEFPVPPLSLPRQAHLLTSKDLAQYTAVSLFAQRAQAVKPDFLFSEANAHAIAEICIHLDGLPLAIELAAARIKLLPPQALLQRLSHLLSLLTGGVQNAPVRQQTLRNTIAWSYRLLGAAEQRLFQRLSVFVGSYTLDAVESVCGVFADGAAHILDGVASLIDNSLLQQTEQEGEEPQFVMLETIREYGLEALASSGEEEITRQAHAAYYLTLAEKAEPEFGGPEQARWLDRLEREHDNLRIALNWSLEMGKARRRMEMALRLGGALRRFWLVHAHIGEGRAFLEQALAERGEVSKPVRAKALIAAANLAVSQNDYDRTETLCQESLALYQELGNQPGIAFSLHFLSVVSWHSGNLTTGQALLEQALALFQEIGDKDMTAWSLYLMGLYDGMKGEYAGAYTLFKESLALHRQMQHKRGISFSLIHMAQALFVTQGDQAKVDALLEEGFALAEELGDKDSLAYSYALKGQIALNQHHADSARSLLEKGVGLYREVGSRQGIAESLVQLARVVATQGDNAAAASLYEESLAIAGELQLAGVIASCLEGLAAINAAREQALSPASTTAVTAPATASAPSSYAGLSAREVEVVRLVAKGLTNTEIADELGLSEKTIAHHLTHIFNKTGSENRAAAASFAIRHGLA